MIHYIFPNFADTGESSPEHLFLTSIERKSDNTVPCSPSEGVAELRDPANLKDPNSLAVMKENGTLVGYLSAKDSAYLNDFVGRKEFFLPAVVMSSDHPKYDETIPVHQTQLAVLYSETLMLVSGSEGDNNCSDPSSGELRGNPVWENFLRQVRDSDRVNLTRLWRASGRKRGYSPRQYARHELHMLGDAEFVGNRADDAVFVAKTCAYSYMYFLDADIMKFMNKMHMNSFRKGPVGKLLSASEYSELDSSILGMLVSVANAVDGNRTEGDARLIAAAVARTQGLDIYAQETAIMKVQRAVAGGAKIPSAHIDEDGELVFDS